ncbi:MAG: hypothetical protein OXC62_15465 [Aestuariivita sp.]|nr:hypothetical protein [Aestuariivita sp.]
MTNGNHHIQGVDGHHLRPARRRGLVALSACVGIFSVLAAAYVMWQLGQANERLRGSARHLADVVTAEGFSVHHWLHDEINRTSPIITVPVLNTARALTAIERGRLDTHFATSRWRRSSLDISRVLLPRGWSLHYLITTIGQHTNGDTLLPEGILVVRPSNDIVNSSTWSALNDALNVVLPVASDQASTLTASAITSFDATRDRAFFVSQFARINTAAVLRQAHVGHAQLAMQTDLVMGTNDLSDVDVLESLTGTAPNITGNCRPGTSSSPLCVTLLTTQADVDVSGSTTVTALTATDMTVSGDVTNISTWRADDVDIETATTSTTQLTACADAEVDICGGGDVDVESGTGDPDWTTVAIFGDTIIRDGNQLNGLTTTNIVENGIFEVMTGNQLTVSGCFRSVTPFVYGARC